MSRKNTDIKRISRELTTELEGFASRNHTNIVEASREFARLIKQNRNKTVLREIKFWKEG